MKLLFDANLSPRLVPRLAELFPGSIHVFDTDLAQHTPDQTIWEYAKTGGYTIVTADSDFIQIAERRGVPPGVVRLENCNYKQRVSKKSFAGMPYESLTRRCGEFSSFRTHLPFCSNMLVHAALTRLDAKKGGRESVKMAS